MAAATEAMKTARRIGALGAWEAVFPWNWAVRPSGAKSPFIVCPRPGERPEVAARLLVFPGWDRFAEYKLFCAKAAPVPAFSPADIEHFEAVFLKSGDPGFVSFFPGYVPREMDGEDSPALRKILRESLGLMMRIEEDSAPNAECARNGAVLGREETSPGAWRDAPMSPPDETRTVSTKIPIPKDGVESAKKLPVVPDLKWDVAFRPVPQLVTPGPERRIFYILAAVDSVSGANARLRLFSVPSGHKRDGLARIWGGIARETLAAFSAAGAIPSELRVSDARLALFLRPLGLHFPFKITVVERLPAAERCLAALHERRFGVRPAPPADGEAAGTKEQA